MTAGPPAAGWPKLTRRSLAAHHPRGRPPSSRTTPCPKVPHPADRHPSEVLPPGILLLTDPGDPGATGCRQQSGVRPKYGTGRWVNWQAERRIPGGVLTSAHLATHSKLKATYARLSRSSPKRPLDRINPQATKGAPRACRGGPPALLLGAALRWVLPARAGVVPSQGTRTSARAGAPRAGGGGPGTQAVIDVAMRCSPRVRGWSRAGHARGADSGVLPARAGVVPPPISLPPG